MKLTELAYFTENVQEMTAFYRRLLDQEPVAQSADMSVFMLGPLKILIHRAYTPGEGDLPPDNHVAFSVPDVDAACDQLVQQGLTLESPPQDHDWGRSAYLRDPDGNQIELAQADDTNARGG